MRIAFVHYWLTGMRGGEKVLEAWSHIFPQADIFTHVSHTEKLSPRLRRHFIQHSFIADLPFARQLYPFYLPLMPRALEQLDLNGYDLILSSEAGPAKGIIPPPDALHICYCHSPMRYVWDQRNVYNRSSDPITQAMHAWFAPALRAWDTQSAARVDRFIANSHFVARRIEKYYRRSADVIHPPINTQHIMHTLQNNTATLVDLPATAEPPYLFVGAITPYKCADIALRACYRMNRPLVIVGQGTQLRHLRHLVRAWGYQNRVRFYAHLSDGELYALMQKARALLAPGIEDFGMTPLEAAACGLPTIACGVGGAAETIVTGNKATATGVLCPRPHSVDAFVQAIQNFESHKHNGWFHPVVLTQFAEKFASARFQKQMHTAVLTAFDTHKRAQATPLYPYAARNKHSTHPLPRVAAL